MTRKSLLLLAAGLSCLLTVGILLQTRYATVTSTTPSMTSSDETYMSCNEYIESLNVPFEAILIDETVLRAIHAQNCAKLSGKLVKLGVETKKADKGILGDKRFDVIPYEDRLENDYLKFKDDVVRIVLRQNTTTFGNLKIPESIAVFLEMWRRSRLLECLGLKIQRMPYDQNAYFPKRKGVRALSSLRDTLLSFGMFSFLQGGSLLGWYRECSLIPHTYDVDVGVFIDDYNPKFLDALIRNETDFHISRRLGMVNDSYEFTVTPESNEKIAMDIFFMYNEGNQSWVGGTSNNRAKFKYFYPRYDPYCAASLLGHLFWVTCRPGVMLKNEYGPSWHIDHPTRKFSWYSSTKNSAPAGYWDEDVFDREVYWTKYQNRTIFEFLEQSNLQ